jgi:hypothetical protein
VRGSLAVLSRCDRSMNGISRCTFVVDVAKLGNFGVRVDKPIDVDPATGNLKTTGIPERYWKPEYRKGWTL